MSRRSSYSVTSHSVSNSNSKEEIFLQPIDQQYEKIKESREIEDCEEFFVEYEQRQNMNNIISMMNDSEFLTDSDTPPNVLIRNLLKEDKHLEEELNPRPRKLSFTKVFLVEKWQRNAKDLIVEQKNKILCSSFYQIRSQIFGNSLRPNEDIDMKPRANSNKLKPMNETDSEMKLSNSVFNTNNKKSLTSINGVGRSNMKTPFV